MILDLQKIWLLSLAAGVLMELGFFLWALSLGTKKAYGMVVLGFVPSILLGVGVPLWCTEAIFNAYA
jgi:hypothetical protein